MGMNVLVYPSLFSEASLDEAYQRARRLIALAKTARTAAKYAAATTDDSNRKRLNTRAMRAAMSAARHSPTVVSAGKARGPEGRGEKSAEKFSKMLKSMRKSK